MRRREFISVMGGVAAWPLAARAQQPGKLPTLGFLGTVTRSTWPVEAFAQRLQELGWIDGRTITVDYRWADGHAERIVEFAAEFVGSKVDLIVTGGNAVASAKQATSTIPIIFAVAVDPVGSGFVESLSRPGGNITGLSLQGPRTCRQARLELLRQIAPCCRRLAIMVNVIAMSPPKRNWHKFSPLQPRLASIPSSWKSGARRISRPPSTHSTTAPTPFMWLPRHWFLPTPLVSIPWPWARECRRSSVPREGIQEPAGLICYGASLPALFHRAAEFADKILRGTKPADIPVEQPTKFELAVNLTTAKALGLSIPPNLLAVADEVIE